jgi:hypothetical protein
MDPANAADTSQPQRPRWVPYLVGALAGALVTIAAVVVFEVAGGDDDRRDPSATTNTRTAQGSTTPSPTSTTGGPPGTVPSPPAIVSFGVETTNCPPGAPSTAVVVTYQTQNTTRVGFSIDGGPPQPGADTSGSQDVGPIPCDAQPHVITMTAENGQLQATRQATVSVS